MWFPVCYSPKPRSRVWILICRKWPIKWKRRKLVFILNSSSNISHRQTFLMKEWVEKLEISKPPLPRLPGIVPLEWIWNILMTTHAWSCGHCFASQIFWARMKMWAISKRNCHYLINIGLLSVGFLKAKKNLFYEFVSRSSQTHNFGKLVSLDRDKQ